MKDFSVQIHWGEAVKIDTENSLLFENKDAIIWIDGIIINEQKIKKRYAAPSLNTLLIEKIKDNQFSILKELQGEFNGFLYRKNEEQVYFFTNPQATRKMFYTQSSRGIFFANRLQKINAYLDSNNLPKDLHLESAYSLLSISNLLENNTLIKQAKKLHSAECLQVDVKLEKCSLSKYLDYRKVEVKGGHINQFVNDFNERFQMAISEEYYSDRQELKPPLAFLSGGLDSRMNVLSAVNQNIEISKVLCFSQKNYLDHSISKKIAAELNLPYQFVNLPNIDFIKPIDELTNLSEFSVYYTGSSHVNYALNQINMQGFSRVHSGQIGDGILGNFNSEPEVKKPSIQKIFSSKRYAFKIEDYVQEIANNYDHEELFLLYNLAFNKTVAGSYVVDQWAPMVSPFFHSEVVEKALEIPPSIKYNHRFYFEWMKQKLPAATRYTWETTALKPMQKYGKFIGEHVLLRMRKYYSLFMNKGKNYQMIPYQYYYKNDENIRNYLVSYFQENLEVLDPWPELKKDAEIQFKQGTFNEKIYVLTLLSSVKALFKP